MTSKRLTLAALLLLSSGAALATPAQAPAQPATAVPQARSTPTQAPQLLAWQRVGAPLSLES